MIVLPIPSLEGLVTERLLFRRLRKTDISWWMDHMNSAAAVRFMPFTVGSHTDGVAMIQRSLDRYVQDGSGLHAILLRDSEVPIGKCGLLTQEVDGRPELEIGYHFLPQHWGHGYAAEAAIAVKGFAFDHRVAPSLISLIDPDNVKSQAVALRNGMVREHRTIHRGTEALVFRVRVPNAV